MSNSVVAKVDANWSKSLDISPVASPEAVLDSGIKVVDPLSVNADLDAEIAKDYPAKKTKKAKKNIKKAETPKETVVEPEVIEAPAPIGIQKMPKTVLADGLHYSLLSRVRNAFPANMRDVQEKGTKMLSLVDGRGQTQEISEYYHKIATDLGGAEYLSSVRSSHVKKELVTQGIIVVAKK